jgi:hypothetical protein
MEHSEVQSVIFKKEKMNPRQCVDWLYEHNLKYNKIDEKEKYYRFRQTNPNKYTHYTTKEIDKKKGIKLIIGWYPISFMGKPLFRG